jgi:uncharacterized caspase-like protein
MWPSFLSFNLMKQATALQKAALLAFWLFFSSELESFGADRVALIFGNGSYTHAGLLKNAPNDAKLLSESLRQGGFEVDLVLDASLEVMESKVLEFSRKARDASAAWFYYAGHGIEVKGVNYLMPVDAKVEEEFQVKGQSLALDTVLAGLEEAQTPLKVIVLDCCRENPFGRSWSRGVPKGLVAVSDSPEGTIIAFAAAPGKVAADSVGGENSPYTLALAEFLKEPGLDIHEVFRRTGGNVSKLTEKQQQPWVNSSVYDYFTVITDPNRRPSPVPNPLPSSAAPKRAILSVGVGKPEKPEIAPLSAVDTDAKKMAGAFRSVGAPSDVFATMTTDEETSSPFYPNTVNIRTQLSSLYNRLAPSDTAVFYFAGYEVQRADDADYYFLTADGNPEDPTTLVALSEVYDALTKSGAGTGIVLIDSCRNQESLPQPTPPAGVAVYFACSSGESAYEDHEIDPPSGYFTDELCAGLKGAADANENGETTWDELTGYVTSEVAFRVSIMPVGPDSQVPEMFGTPGQLPVFQVHQPLNPAPPRMAPPVELSPKAP